MSALTEAEIFDCLRTNFGLAAQHCEDLARLPKKGPTYRQLIAELKLIEGAARQAAYWRQDARWLAIGLKVEEAHKRAGHWLRKHYPAPLFLKLADNLRAGAAIAERYRTARTGRIGPILPKPRPAPHRDTRPVQVMLPPGMTERPSGLIVPAGVA